MQPLSLQTLAGSAYRTLGLSGRADQASIDLAARRLRLWTDPAQVPPTPWDLPRLGPIDRSRPALEQAVARLYRPESRVWERLIWYSAPAPPGDTAAAPAAAGDAAPAEHDLVVAALHALWLSDPRVGNLRRWATLWKGVSRLAGSLDFVEWMLRVEDAGGFEQRASIEEIGLGMARLLPALAHGLIPAARAALGRGDKPADVPAVALLRREPTAFAKLLNELEDDFAGECRRVAADLGGTIGTDPQSPGAWYIHNRYKTFFADETCREVIRPRMGQLLELLGADEPDRRQRVAAACADLLRVIAQGWEWGGEPVLAKKSRLEAWHLTSSSGEEPPREPPGGAGAKP